MGRFCCNSFVPYNQCFHLDAMFPTVMKRLLKLDLFQINPLIKIAKGHKKRDLTIAMYLRTGENTDYNDLNILH